MSTTKRSLGGKSAAASRPTRTRKGTGPQIAAAPLSSPRPLDVPSDDVDLDTPLSFLPEADRAALAQRRVVEYAVAVVNAMTGALEYDQDETFREHMLAIIPVAEAVAFAVVQRRPSADIISLTKAARHFLQDHAPEDGWLPRRRPLIDDPLGAKLELFNVVGDALKGGEVRAVRRSSVDWGLITKALTGQWLPKDAAVLTRANAIALSIISAVSSVDSLAELFPHPPTVLTIGDSQSNLSNVLAALLSKDTSVASALRVVAFVFGVPASKVKNFAEAAESRWERGSS